MKILLCCVFVFLSVLTGVYNDPIFAEIPNSDEELVEQIILLDSEEKYHKALKMINDFLLDHPDSVEAGIYRCVELNLAEYPVDEIKQCLDKIPIEHSQELIVMLNYGVLHYKMENYKESQKILDETRQKYPENLRAKILFYTVSLIIDPANSEYIDELKKIAKQTHDIQALSNVIKFLNDKNELDESNQLLLIAEENDRENPDILVHRGVWYAKKNDLQSAEDLFQQALKQDRSITVLNNLGLLYRELGDKERSIDHYNKSIRYYTSVETIEPENIWAVDGIKYSQDRIFEINVLFWVGSIGVSFGAGVAVTKISNRKTSHKKLGEKKDGFLSSFKNRYFLMLGVGLVSVLIIWSTFPEDQKWIIIVSLMAVLATLLVGEVNRFYKAKELQTSILLKIFDSLNSVEQREIRRKIFYIHCKIHGCKEKKPDRKMVFPMGHNLKTLTMQARAPFGQIQIFLEQGVLSKTLFLKLYAGMVCRLWYVLEEDIIQEREDTKNFNIAKHFEDLACDSEKFLGRKEIPYCLPMKDLDDDDELQTYLSEFKNAKTKKKDQKKKWQKKQ